MNQNYETDITKNIRIRAQVIKKHGSIQSAIEAGDLNKYILTTLSEGIVLGLLKQGVKKYLAIFGHGSTDLGEVLRIYEEEGVTKTFNFRNEIVMAHAATSLSWAYQETPAVVTSIGPGGLQAMAGSLAASSNGVGVYHIYGDETTHGEGYNMQQIPKPEQGLYGQLTAIMGESYILHTPEALRDCMRRGTARVHHPTKSGPFYILLPLNTQPQSLKLNLTSLPERLSLPALRPEGEKQFKIAEEQIQSYNKIVIKAGGGSRQYPNTIKQLAEKIGASVVLSPGSTGVLPDLHPQNMHVGGSKGSICGNYAMAEGELLIVIGSRGVCQADCSGIGFKQVRSVININADLTDVTHYNKTIALQGDINAVIGNLLKTIEKVGGIDLKKKQSWLLDCKNKKEDWKAFKNERYNLPPIPDPAFERKILTQPAAIKVTSDFAKEVGAVKYFDAGDVQANGFQIVEDDSPHDTFTESGASYMGFAVSGILASALVDHPRYPIAFTGDGSFMMNPAVLIDGVEHDLKGMIVIFDNRRMGAISGLQKAQYGHEFKTKDSVIVDYVSFVSSISGVQGFEGSGNIKDLKSTLREAFNYDGLSVVHVPVYSGLDEYGGMGAYGEWNVGNWCEKVQLSWNEQDL